MAQNHESNLLKLNSSTLFFHDFLYCTEGDLEEESITDRDESECCRDSNRGKQNNSFPVLLVHDLVWEDDELPCLMARETGNRLCEIISSEPSLAVSRREAVDWMLKVIAHYSFSAHTAILAVNYLDRFLFSFHLQSEKPWMSQLAAVACLSLAAKVEETQVPLLLDLQVEDSKCVFEAKTIQRMEILVLSTLDWRMNPVTPLSFLDYIARRLGLKDHLCLEFIRRCELIILSVISDSRFMYYLPSVMATATLLHVVNNVAPSLRVEYETQLLGILGITKEKVDECCNLIMELTLLSNHHGNESKKRKLCSIPGSPNGVMDVSLCSDSSNESWSMNSSMSSSSPEPLIKKNRGEYQILQRVNNSKTETPPDFLSIHR